MKKSALFAIAAIGLAVLAAGCTERKVVYVPAPQSAYPPGPIAGPPPGPPPGYPPAPVQQEVIIAQAPPPPQVEVIPVAPGPNYVWTSGYWYWGGGRWMWTRGTYVARPGPRAVWVGPHYVKRHGGYVWVGGMWK